MRIRHQMISDYDEIVALWQRTGLSYKPEGRDRKDTVQTQMVANPDFFVGAFEGSGLKIT